MFYLMFVLVASFVLSSSISVSLSFSLASSTTYIISVSSNSCRFLESAISLLAFASVWVTSSFATMLLFGTLLTLCFDKVEVKDVLSLILLLFRFLDLSGSNFCVLKRDSIPERLDLTCDATSIVSKYFL